MPIDVDAVVISNDRLSSDYNVVRLAAPEIATLSRPGQFLMVKKGFGDTPLLRRPFSVFEIFRGTTGNVEGLSLLNKSVGVVTSSVFSLEPGQHLKILGPLGKPFSVIESSGEAWMIAGGVGLAPFLTLAETLRSAGVPSTLFYGGRSSSDLYYVDRFEHLDVRIIVTTEDGSLGETGLITGPLKRELQTLETDKPMIYACGPTPMMRAVSELADQYGCSSEVSLEPVMGCGLGGCYSCIVPVRDGNAPPRLVRGCLNGPIFAGNQIAWSHLG